MKKVYNVNIENEYPLPTPHEILSELPLTSSDTEHIYAARNQIEDIITRRDKRIMMICGPCSIDSIPAALEYAMKLRSIQDKVSPKIMLIMRAYFEKPRTTVGWKGMIYDPDLDHSFNIEKGLRLARKLLIQLAELRVPAATEFLEPIIPQYFADLISWASIGARTSESQTHRQLASGLSMPVGFKNSTDGAVSNAVDAIKTASAKHSFLGVINDGRTGVFRTKGNKHCHLILRGGSHNPNYGSENIAYAKELMKKANITPSIVVDCSHGNSMRKPENQPLVMRDILGQIKAGETAISGLMMESYMKTGRQDISEKGKMIPGLSITDSCLGWKETEAAIIELYNELPG